MSSQRFECDLGSICQNHCDPLMTNPNYLRTELHTKRTITQYVNLLVEAAYGRLSFQYGILNKSKAPTGNCKNILHSPARWFFQEGGGRGLQSVTRHGLNYKEHVHD
jgi:hypothetical protein